MNRILKRLLAQMTQLEDEIRMLESKIDGDVSGLTIPFIEPSEVRSLLREFALEKRARLAMLNAIWHGEEE